MEEIKPYYQQGQAAIYFEDTFKVMAALEQETIDMIYADPPYFLSNGGITCHAGEMVSVDKGDWDKVNTFEEKHIFNRAWIRLCKRLLKKDGTIWISGTLHNIYSVGAALEQEGFKIINNITWQKTNPPPNLACRCFTHSTETILWAKKDEKGVKHLFNYDIMKQLNDGKQMKDVWTSPLTPRSEKKEGKHPTQKPVQLISRMIEASTRENDIVLDPFCGSSTTGVAALRKNRQYIGIENNLEFVELSIRRLKAEGL